MISLSVSVRSIQSLRNPPLKQVIEEEEPGYLNILSSIPYYTIWDFEHPIIPKSLSHEGQNNIFNLMILGFILCSL